MEPISGSAVQVTFSASMATDRFHQEPLADRSTASPGFRFRVVTRAPLSFRLTSRAVSLSTTSTVRPPSAPAEMA